MTREEMREKVARLLALETEGSEEWWTLYMRRADAAIAIIRGETLEEAARVAETPVETMCCNNPLWNGNPEDQPECCGAPECRWGDPGEIAAAIRALAAPSGAMKDKP